MTIFLTRMPAGIPGVVSRQNSAIIEAIQYDAANAFPRYGMFGKTIAGLFRPLESGDAATVVTGLLVRPYPTNSSTQGLGAATPPVGGIADRLLSGYMSVTLKLGTAAKDGQVYVVTTAGGSVAVGDIVTAASPAGGGTAVAVVGAFFEGPADAIPGNVEIRFNI